MTDPTLSILIVNYNTPELTLACLDSIKKFPPSGDYEIIVVDNASSDDSVDRIRRAHPDVNLITSPENLGFAGGNNLAMERAKNEILVLLNSDTEVQPQALSRLQQFFRENPDAAAAGGKHFKTDGSIQLTIKYFPRLSNMVSEAFFLHRLFSGPCWNERESRLDHYEKLQEVEWVAGSYLAVRRSWYEKIGGLDAGFFMYSEDTDWCYRIRRAGGSIWYLPDSVITHHCGGSSRGDRSLSITLCLSRDRYARLHFPKWKSTLYRMALFLGLVVRGFGFLAVTPFDKENLSLAKQRLRAAVSLYTCPLPLAPEIRKTLV